MEASGFPCPSCKQDNLLLVLKMVIKDHFVILLLKCPVCEESWWEIIKGGSGKDKGGDKDANAHS